VDFVDAAADCDWELMLASFSMSRRSAMPFKLLTSTTLAADAAVE
jgi:hypothetical protein